MSSLLIIFLTVFIDLLGFGIIIPLLPFYAERFGGSALTVGLLGTSFSLMQFIFAPMWGRLSDRIGRRPVILVGLFGSFVSYLAFGFANTLPLLFVSRSFAGVAGATIPTAQAFIADTTTPENRAKGMGMVGAAFGLGFIFGPAIGGFLSHWGHIVPPLFAAALSLANFSLAVFLLPESLKRRADGARPVRQSRFAAFRRALARPHMPALLLVYFVVVAAFSGFESTFALFAEHRFGFTASTIGYMFAYIGVLFAFVQGGLVGRAVRWLGERRLVPISILIASVALALVAASHSLTALCASMALLALGMGLNGPSIVSLISRWSSADDQGGMLGLSQGLASLSRIVGPAWGGLVFDQVGPSSPYVSSSVLLLGAFGIAVVGLWNATAGIPASEVGSMAGEG
jgi:DHA1 family tetracycline resistance protein-like MFS transporter